MHIVIIGYGPGISSATAHLFGKKGFEVSIIGRTVGKLKAEAEALSQQSIKASYAVGDVADALSINSALDQVIGSQLPEVVLYNPSASVYKQLEDDDWDSIQQQFAVNVGGAVHVLKRFLPLARKTNRGNLFFTGGGLSINPSPLMAGLGMGKAALRNLILGTAAGLKETNVHVGMVTVQGMVDPAHAKYNPEAIADNFWKLYNQQPGHFETEIMY